MKVILQTIDELHKAKGSGGGAGAGGSPASVVAGVVGVGLAAAGFASEMITRHNPGRAYAKEVKLNSNWKGKKKKKGLKKAQVKGFIRYKKGKMERVSPYSRTGTFGSQKRESLESAGYDLVSKKGGREVILKDKESGKYELWGRKDDFAGYTIDIGGKGYEFIRDVDREVQSPFKASPGSIPRLKKDKYTKEELRDLWAKEKTINVKGREYRIGKMSYGDFFLEPVGKERGETKGFARGTIWQGDKDFPLKDVGNINWEKFAKRAKAKKKITTITDKAGVVSHWEDVKKAGYGELSAKEADIVWARPKRSYLARDPGHEEEAGIQARRKYEAEESVKIPSRVKPFVRTRRGKMEHVTGYERKYTGEPHPAVRAKLEKWGKEALKRMKEKGKPQGATAS